MRSPPPASTWCWLRRHDLVRSRRVRRRRRHAASICIAEGVTSAWLGCRRRSAPAALAAWLIGAVSPAHARRVFIMITLAFAQMAFYLVNSMKAYGRRRRLEPAAARRAGPGLIWATKVCFTTWSCSFSPYRSMASQGHAVRFRQGGDRDRRERGEGRGDRLAGAPLPARLLRHHRRGRAGSPGRSCEPRKYVNPNVLHWVSVRHADDHGDPGRGRPALGRRHRASCSSVSST